MSIGVETDDTSTAFIIIAMTTQTIALFFDAYISDGALKKYRIPIFLGYVLRIIILLLDIYGKSFINIYNSGPDAEAFYSNSVQLALTDKSERTNTFIQLMAIIFKCVGTNRIYGQFLFVMCSIIILCIFAKTLILLNTNEKAANILMYIICFLPNFAMMSSIFIREIPVAMLAAVSIYCFLYWMRKNNYLYLTISFVSVLLGSTLHAGVSAMCAGYVFIIFIYNANQKSFIFSPSGLFFAILFTCVFLFLFVNYGDTFFQKFMKIETTEDISENVESGSSSYARYVGSSKTPLNMVIFTIPRMIYFLFSPFPWQWRSTTDMFAFLFSSLYYAAAIFLAIRTIVNYRGEKRYIAVSLIIIAICVVFVFGWGVNNTGTALRHRDKLIMLFGAMQIIYFADLYSKRKKITIATHQKI